MSWWTENKWSVSAAAFLLFGMMLARGGAASLGPLLRIAIPVCGVVFGLRFLKGRFQSAVRMAVKDLMAQQKGSQSFGGVDAANTDRGKDARGGRTNAGRSQRNEAAPVIDLCPRCGSYLKPGHLCNAQRQP